jgi:hypothetical protein
MTAQECARAKSMSVILRKLTIIARFLLEIRVAVSFLKETLTGNSYLEILQDWLFTQLNEERRLHFAARRSTTTLAQPNSSVPKLNIGSTLHWTHENQRPGTTFWTPKIPIHDTM